MASAYLHAKYETNGAANEITAGSATYSTKEIYFPHLGASPAVDTGELGRDDEVRNENEPLPVFPDTYDPKVPFQMRGYPDSLGFLFKWLWGAPTTTAGDGVIVDLAGTAVPAGATRHTWTAPFAASNTPQTCRVDAAYVDQSTFFQGNGMACSQLDLSMDDLALQVAATIDGLYMPRVANPSLSPTYESISVQPFKPRNCKLSTWLASTAITVQGGVKMTCTNPFEKVRSMGVASRWPDILDKTDVCVVSGELDQRYVNSTDWDAMTANTGFAALITWINDSIITGAYPYKLFAKFTNIQYLGGTVDQMVNTRRHGATYQWKATDSGAGGSTIIQLVNATASYA